MSDTHPSGWFYQMAEDLPVLDDETQSVTLIAPPRNGQLDTTLAYLTAHADTEHVERTVRRAAVLLLHPFEDGNVPLRCPNCDTVTYSAMVEPPMAGHEGFGPCYTCAIDLATPKQLALPPPDEVVEGVIVEDEPPKPRPRGPGGKFIARPKP